MGWFDRDKEKKKKPDFSNVESGSSSTAPKARTEGQTHVVEKGESLWAIAERYYGDGNEWPRIHEANRERIEDPDVIHPGWELTIPPAKEDEEEV